MKCLTMMSVMAVLCIAFAGCRPIPLQAHLKIMIKDGSVGMLDKIEQDRNYGRWIKSDLAPAHLETQGTQQQEMEKSGDMVVDVMSPNDNYLRQPSIAVDKIKEPEYNKYTTSGLYSGVIQNDPNDELERSEDVSARVHIETQGTQRQVENYKQMIADEWSPVKNTVTDNDLEQPFSAEEETKEPEYNRHATSGLYSGVIQNAPNDELEGSEDVSAPAHIETQGTQRQVENYKEMIADELSPIENTVTDNDLEQPSSAVEETIEPEHNSHTTSGQFSDMIQNDLNDEHEGSEDVSGTDKKSYVELRPEEVKKLLEIYDYFRPTEKRKKYFDVTTVTSPPNKNVASNKLDSILDLGIKSDRRMKVKEKKEKLKQKMFRGNDKIVVLIPNIMVSQLDGDRGVVRPLDEQ